MMITINKHAEPGERFAPDCLDGQVGKRLPLRVGALQLGYAVLAAYIVIDEGREVLITLDVELADTLQLRRKVAR